MDEMSLRVGVIGAGLMGSTHGRLLSGSVAEAEVVAVSDAIAASAQRLADEVGVGTVYTDAGELIEDPSVDAVVIASPADTHEAFVLACFDAGKPVLCEKPLASTAAAARHVLEAEAATERPLVQVGFMRRFDPDYVSLKARIDGGEIGRPLLTHCAHRNRTVPERFDSEMILRDSTVHDIDTVRWLLGQELVKATVLTPRPSRHAPDGVQDPLLVVFQTDAGALVDVEAFVNAQYGYDIRCEVVGETGTAALPLPGADVPAGFQERFAAAYVGELAAWVASIAGGIPVGARAWDGYAAALVSEAAVESLRTGEPVEVEIEQGVTS
jgi:myo-inositol 2-dehydrogenase / D-chiro-inositol 1-dehydrogenase